MNRCLVLLVLVIPCTLAAADLPQAEIDTGAEPLAVRVDWSTDGFLGDADGGFVSSSNRSTLELNGCRLEVTLMRDVAPRVLLQDPAGRELFRGPCDFQAQQLGVPDDILTALGLHLTGGGSLQDGFIALATLEPVGRDPAPVE